ADERDLEVVIELVADVLENFAEAIKRRAVVVKDRADLRLLGAQFEQASLAALALGVELRGVEANLGRDVDARQFEELGLEAVVLGVELAGAENCEEVERLIRRLPHVAEEFGEATSGADVLLTLLPLAHVCGELEGA